MSAVVEKLEQLAEQDDVLAPLARVYALVLRYVSAPDSSLLASSLDPEPITDGATPALHGRTLLVDVGQATRLVTDLVELLARSGITGSEAVAPAVRTGRLAVLDLVRAGITANTELSSELGQRASVSPDIMATCGQLLATPFLVVAARELGERGSSSWPAGYCPICAAWPALAEFRGLERDRWLRCARCGAGWRYPHQQCPFCANSDHHRLRYLAEEGRQDAQRVEVCEQCRGYVKTFATLGPWSHGEVLLHDLTTVELDLAATEREYHRPDGLGFPLAVTLLPRELAG
jgi:FdhE protein